MNFEVPDQIRLHSAYIWAFHLHASDSDLSRLGSSLSPDECARADRFLTDELRRRYVIARGVLRTILGELTSTPAQQLEFRYGQWGKPELRSGAVHFNVSHSADVALVAVSLSPIGIDVEVPNERINCRAISSQVLSPEEATQWEKIPAKLQSQEIMKLWVCKESLLKSMGLGIAEGLGKISFPMPLPEQGEFSPSRIDATLQLHLDDDGSCRMNRWTDASFWRTQLLPEFSQVYSAVTVPTSTTEILCQTTLNDG